MTSRSDARDRPLSPGLAEALRLLRLEKRRPTEADRPPPSTLPGRKLRPLAGQLELGAEPEETLGDE